MSKPCLSSRDVEIIVIFTKRGWQGLNLGAYSSSHRLALLLHASTPKSLSLQAMARFLVRVQCYCSSENLLGLLPFRQLFGCLSRSTGETDVTTIKPNSVGKLINYAVLILFRIIIHFHGRAFLSMQFCRLQSGLKRKSFFVCLFPGWEGVDLQGC